MNRLQLVADRIGMVDVWVDDGVTEAIDLYKRKRSERPAAALVGA